MRTQGKDSSRLSLHPQCVPDNTERRTLLCMNVSPICPNLVKTHRLLSTLRCHKWGWFNLGWVGKSIEHSAEWAASSLSVKSAKCHSPLSKQNVCRVGDHCLLKANNGQMLSGTQVKQWTTICLELCVLKTRPAFPRSWHTPLSQCFAAHNEDFEHKEQKVGFPDKLPKTKNCGLLLHTGWDVHWFAMSSVGLTGDATVQRMIAKCLSCHHTQLWYRISFFFSDFRQQCLFSLLNKNNAYPHARKEEGKK